MSRFHVTWEPTLLSEELVAHGTWWHQDTIPHRAELWRQRYDYTSRDLVELEQILGVPNIDYINYKIDDSGAVYIWRFLRDGSTWESPFLSTYYDAFDHIKTYGCRHKIEWNHARSS